MDQSTYNRIVSLNWSIAGACLRDVFVRGRYRDVILPMFVLRRLDCLLESSKDALLDDATQEILASEAATEGMLKQLVALGKGQ